MYAKANRLLQMTEKSHPTYQDMVVESVVSLKDRKGTSLHSIKKYLLEHWNLKEDNSFKTNINNALKKCVELGKLIKIKASYKVNPDAKLKTKGKAKGKAKGKEKKADGRGKGLQAPMRLSPALAEVCKAQELSRPMVVSKIWEYIKANKLQDPANRQHIRCDNRLKSLFGGTSNISMFEMNKHITKHLSKI